MATTCFDLYGYVYPTDSCVPVHLKIEEDVYKADMKWIIGASFLGLILGILLVAILTKPFLIAWRKKKKHDEEKALEKSNAPDIVSAHAVNGWVSQSEKNKIKGEKIVAKGKSKKLRFWRKNKEKKQAETSSEENVDPAFTRGMVEVMAQTTNSSADVEMGDQDMSAIVSMERGIREEKNKAFIRILAILLRKKMEKREITKEFYTDFIQKAEEDMKDISKVIAREKEEDEEKLKKDPKLSKDSQALESELQNLQTHYNEKQNESEKAFKEKLRLDLLRTSGLSEQDVEAMIVDLMDKMSKVEEKIGLEQARQRRALEQRLAKRKMMVEYNAELEKEKQMLQEQNMQVFDGLLAMNVKDGSMLESQKDEILIGLENDFEEIHKFHDDEFNNLWSDKSDWLHQHRIDSFYQLGKKHDKEKAALKALQDDKTTATDFITVYHDLMTRQHMDQEALGAKLDEEEAQERQKLKTALTQKEAKQMSLKVKERVENIEATTNMTSSEAGRMIKAHKLQIEKFELEKQRERQAMMTRLQERLQHRLAAADEAEARDQREQEMLKEEQMATINKVLTTNTDLTEDAKDRILKEHEQNMQALSNQLSRSKMRQQKSLEMKLNQRKAKLEELKNKQAEMERSRKEVKEAEKAKLADQIAKEENDLEAAKAAAIADLRKQLAEETANALKAQDQEIGLLIGRLQVGQARRKAILEKQDARIKELQKLLEEKVTENGVVPPSQAEQLLQQHHNHVSYLNDKLQQSREKQEMLIAQKLNNKKAAKEEEIEARLEKDAQIEYRERKERGAGQASLALMQSFLEQRHARALADLETEMKAELEKSKNELNLNLEQELKSALDAQQQELLTQLASISNLSKGELNEAVSDASRANGKANSKAAKKLVKNLRDGVSKSNFSRSNDYYDSD